MGFGLGLAVCLEMVGWGGSLNCGGFIVRETHGCGINEFLFAIYLHIYLFI